MPTQAPTLTYNRDYVDHEAQYDPLVQNTPLDPLQAHLRPPPPRMPAHPDIFIGIASFRDGHRCGFTLWTAFARAKDPSRVFFGVVDQTSPGDAICLDEYCKRAKETWPDEPCKFQSHVKVDARNATESKGPVIARYQQQQLIGDQVFCMELDAHSQFLPDWDTGMLREWERTGNEMAVLTNYPMAYEYMGEGLTIQSVYSSHLATYLKRKAVSDIPIIGGYSLIQHSEAPQMAALWGGCLSFSKCHAEKRAPMDKYMDWIFWGEEYLRSMQLWTHGYDLYSPSRHGHTVFHNWTIFAEKKKFWDHQDLFPNKAREEAMAYNRLRTMLTLPFQGEVDTRELHRFGPGRVRSIDQFLAFSGISNTDPAKDVWPTAQLHWVPYAVPAEVEALVPGWTLHGQTRTPAASPEAPNSAGSVAPNTSALHDELQQLATQLESDRGATEKLMHHIRAELGKLHQASQMNPYAHELLPVAVAACGVMVLVLLVMWRRRPLPVHKMMP